MHKYRKVKIQFDGVVPTYYFALFELLVPVGYFQKQTCSANQSKAKSPDIYRQGFPLYN